MLAARSAGKHQATMAVVLRVILYFNLYFKLEDDFGNLVYKYKHFKGPIFRKSWTMLGGSIVTSMVDYTGQRILPIALLPVLDGVYSGLTR